MGFQWRHTADYVHQDNSAVENMIRKIDRIMRVNFASAPWVPYTTWPGSATYACQLLEELPVKDKDN